MTCARWLAAHVVPSRPAAVLPPGGAEDTKLLSNAALELRRRLLPWMIELLQRPWALLVLPLPMIAWWFLSVAACGPGPGADT